MKMKKTTLFIALFAFVFSGFAQEGDKKYKMFEILYLTPRTDKIVELREALKKHNSTYHTEGQNKVSVWNIHTGPHTGDLAWVMGPLTFTELDSRVDGKEHNEDWVKNVMPNVKHVSDGEYWKQDDELSYIPEGSFSGNEVWTVYDVVPFEGYRFTELLEKVVEVYKAKSYPNYFSVYRSQFDGGNGHDVAIGFGFKNYAFFDEEDKFWKDYEEVHGENSRWKFFEEYREVVSSSYDELSELDPEMSAGSED
jgi:hypothetical protein